MTSTTHDGGPPIDWKAIERLPEYRELARGRARFAWIAGVLGVGYGALYVVLAATAHDLMRTSLGGSFSLGFAGGVSLVLVTWAITFAYMRRSRLVWGPMEARVRELARDLTPATAEAGGRFVRGAAAPATTRREVVR
jgi:uncharacterized membrane protein (DUF485 family)